ncbi:regucalcin-like [Belonocnema kinseyi]|uniref:regucalcin-like n=1 Tax=Belonocnema kinseyi TaxID=2817044 RepID=UPI00143D7FB4|nr:regucalcin-like [Belonocnema kinseyi]
MRGRESKGKEEEPGYLSFAVPIDDHTDKFVLGVDKKIIIIRWNSFENKFHPDWGLLETVDQTIPSNILTYGTVDNLGRLIFGTMNTDGLKLANISSLNFKLDLKTHISGFAWCKGLVVDTYSPQSKWYLVNSDRHYNLLAYNYQMRNGRIGSSQAVFDWTQQRMTGSLRRLTVDRDGKLWIALDGGHGIIRVDAKGRNIMKYVGMPVLSVGACTFGGPKSDILFISTIPSFHENHNGQKDKGGSIFAVLGLGVRGLPTKGFRLLQNIIESKLP